MGVGGQVQFERDQRGGDENVPPNRPQSKASVMAPKVFWGP